MGIRIWKDLCGSRVIGVGVLLLALMLPGQGIPQDVLQRISIAPDGSEADSNSDIPVMSSGAEAIAFRSNATNLVTGDANGSDDIFVYDRTSGSISRISNGFDGSEANGYSFAPAISGDGRVIAFASDATNLVAGDTAGRIDCFLYNRDSGVTTRVTAPGGVEGNFDSCGTLFLYYGTTSLNSDGSYFAFMSIATNLVTGDTNSVADIFVYEVATGSITRVSVATDGTQANDWSTGGVISPDGRFVAFTSSATNLIGNTTLIPGQVYIHDRLLGTTAVASSDINGVAGDAVSGVGNFNSDGTLLALGTQATNLGTGDANGFADAYIKNLVDGSVSRVSISDAGEPNQPVGVVSISADGSSAVFTSTATNLTADTANGQRQCFAKDMGTGTVTLISKAASGELLDRSCDNPVMDHSGRYVVFSSAAGNTATPQLIGADNIYLLERDLCPTDSAKMIPGTCGCGFSDDDLNGNGNADCFDPAEGSLPATPLLTRSGNGRLKVSMQQYPGATVSYRITANRILNGQIVERRRAATTRATKIFRNLAAGLWKVRYLVKAGSAQSAVSNIARKRLR